MTDSSAEKINFDGLTVLVLEQSEHGIEIMAQMFMGFGARTFVKCTSIDQARQAAQRATIDLIVVDPNLKEGDGLEFVRWVRIHGAGDTRTAPVLVASASGTLPSVVAARDAGASFFLAKPLTPQVLMDRILRVMRDRRSFVVSGMYAGPDRRFKMEGPPPGKAPRRSTDITGALSTASEPNLSQDELDNMFKPQKVFL